MGIAILASRIPAQIKSKNAKTPAATPAPPHPFIEKGTENEIDDDPFEILKADFVHGRNKTMK
jgi:hypothetical protein